LSGGSDEPSGMQSFTAGDITFPLAADSWSNTNGLRAVQDVAESEYGLFYTARGGTLTYHPYTWLFTQLPTAAALDLSNEPDSIDPEVSLKDIVNEVIVEYIPRRRSAAGIVVAKANGPLYIPAGRGLVPQWRIARRNLASDPGTNTHKIPCVEGETGNIIGATQFIQPVAGTDYSVRTGDKSSAEFDAYSKHIEVSLDVTSLGLIDVTLAKAGGDIEATFHNRARRALYVHDFQVRGTALITYDKQEIVRQDATSIAAYGRRTKTIRLPFPSDRRFAESIAEYELARAKAARTMISKVQFKNTRAVGGTDLYSLEFGDVITITDTQTAISAHRYMIGGWTAKIDIGGSHTLVWNVHRLDDLQTWILEDAVYSELDSTTILAL